MSTTKGKPMDIDVTNPTTVGGILGGLSAAIAGGWKLMAGRVEKVETATKSALDDLWRVVDTERETASKFRTQMTGDMAKLPTREEFRADLTDFKADIRAMLHPQAGE